ncbi:MAG: DUF4115 domain-containing protein [Methylobacterium sp.]|nr:DUF4115 domain-containing protein [Methylobacterium sp.]
MSEESIPDLAEIPADGPGLQDSVGETLAAARNAAGMSIDEVAAKLRLSARQIRALEEDDTANLPDATFVRGFLRNYAKLLGLEAEPLIAAYAAQAPSLATQSISLHSENIHIPGNGRKNWLPYLLAILLMLSALAAWLIFMDQHASPQLAAPLIEQPKPAGQPSPEESKAQPVTPVELPPIGMPAPALPEAQPAAAMAPVGESRAAVSAAGTGIPVPGAAKLEMTFSEEVWLSVLDRDGKEIFNKTKPANSRDSAEGLPPLQLVIGNAAGIRLTFKGKPVDLVPHTQANVARLTLE